MIMLKIFVKINVLKLFEYLLGFFIKKIVMYRKEKGNFIDFKLSKPEIK